MIANVETKTKVESRLHNPQLRAYIALAIGIVCIGFSAIFTKWAGVPGPVSGFYRVIIATVVLALPYAFKAVRNRRRVADDGRWTMDDGERESKIQNPKSQISV